MSDKIRRKRMSDTRKAVSHKFVIGNTKGYLTVGLFDDGTPGEIFVHVDKAGSTINGMMDSLAIMTSMALQYGVPLEEVVRKMSFQMFEPHGMTQNPDIRYARSIIDYVFRWIGFEFVDGYRKEMSAKAEVADGNGS